MCDSGLVSPSHSCESFDAFAEILDTDANFTRDSAQEQHYLASTHQHFTSLPTFPPPNVPSEILVLLPTYSICFPLLKKLQDLLGIYIDVGASLAVRDARQCL